MLEDELGWSFLPELLGGKMSAKIEKISILITVSG